MKSLQTFAVIIPSLLHVQEATDNFSSILHKVGWVISANRLDFAANGDSIDYYCTVLHGVHKSTASIVHPLSVITPPHTRSKPISDFIHKDYNSETYSVSFARQYLHQYSDDKLIAVDPMPSPPPRSLYFSRRMYDLIPVDSAGAPTLGCGVYNCNHLFPPLAPTEDGTW
jgi:hypothetical protein